MEQKIIKTYSEMDEWLADKKKVLLVCDHSLKFLGIRHYFDDWEEKFVKFDNFQPNPLYESVVDGVKAYHDFGCDNEYCNKVCDSLNRVINEIDKKQKEYEKKIC